MKRFLRNTLLLLLPFLAAAMALLWMPLPRKWAYNYAAKDCRNAVWIQRRLYEDARPVDIAFVGSSRTYCAVDDGMLDTLLSGSGMHVANISLCRFGRDAQLAVLQDLLDTKKPKWVVIEVNEREPFNTHLSYPALAAPGQVLDPMSPLNRDYFKNIGLAVGVRHRFIQERIFGTTEDTLVSGETNLFYHVRGHESIPAAKAAEYRSARMPEGTRGGTVRQRSAWEYVSSKAYLREMVERCQGRGVQVAFLYLPSYTNLNALPSEGDFYESLGPLWLPPADSIASESQWRDVNHLNYRATPIVARWLAGHLRNQNP